MIAFDTNMLVRALVLDNLAQVDVVRHFMATDTVAIGRVPSLETYWALEAS
jgi:hypothetical protein